MNVDFNDPRQVRAWVVELAGPGNCWALMTQNQKLFENAMQRLIEFVMHGVMTTEPFVPDPLEELKNRVVLAAHEWCESKEDGAQELSHLAQAVEALEYFDKNRALPEGSRERPEPDVVANERRAQLPGAFRYTRG